MLKYDPFMVILKKHTSGCNNLYPKISVPKERKDINVKEFNLITNKNEAKTIKEHVSCGFKCNFNSTTCNLNQKNGLIKNFNMNVKIILSAKKKNIVGILPNVFLIKVSI